MSGVGRDHGLILHAAAKTDVSREHYEVAGYEVFD
jgi:hypothetical protein